MGLYCGHHGGIGTCYFLTAIPCGPYDTTQAIILSLACVTDQSSTTNFIAPLTPNTPLTLVTNPNDRFATAGETLREN